MTEQHIAGTIGILGRGGSGCRAVGKQVIITASSGESAA
jgi:hypothetical protein